MRIQKDTDERVSFSINDVIHTCDKVYIEWILFAHTFSGCDTTSIIDKFGKTSILNKFKTLSASWEVAELFYLDNMSPDDIGNAAVRVFELLHSPKSTLQQIRRQKYDAMVATNISKIDPALLPPAFYHGLRIYHQIQVWKGLRNTNFDPLHWGWQMLNDRFVTILTDVAGITQFTNCVFLTI